MEQRAFRIAVVLLLAVILYSQRQIVAQLPATEEMLRAARASGDTAYVHRVFRRALRVNIVNEPTVEVSQPVEITGAVEATIVH